MGRESVAQVLFEFFEWYRRLRIVRSRRGTFPEDLLVFVGVETSQGAQPHPRSSYFCPAPTTNIHELGPSPCLRLTREPNSPCERSCTAFLYLDRPWFRLHEHVGGAAYKGIPRRAILRKRYICQSSLQLKAYDLSPLRVHLSVAIQSPPI
ncbi:uncharacterized protein BDZ99DRAFT_55341 [Mytilinidion resinicola]|uniref:Uncharacterized protein n=1 Tax=Mytilinidion resinicola TaxID=574789 RepID=A0A6A6YIP4_9PEZI|nr:uncharacterized protein BDZ99DRAFT_55341 [Mytilinidion resinicola]KAF2808418.1 hypothetical protein BDZ99DRAFT_55341 [Mytilinidion resinicola]